MMKIGVCEKDLPGGLDENLKFLSENGFAGLQIWPDKIADVKELRKKCSDLGLEISALGGGPNLVSPGERSRSVDAFRERFDMAGELGCTVVTAETKEKPEGLSVEDAWESCVETVGEVCDYAEKCGCFLAVEPSGSCFVSDYRMWLELARKTGSGALKVNYDPANIILGGEDPVEGVGVLSSVIVHTHAKNIVFDGETGYREGSSARSARDVSLEEGLVDYEAYIKAIMDIGYRGFLAIEMHCRPGEDRRDDVLKSKKFLEKLLSGARDED